MTCNVTGTAISPNGQIKPGAKITFRRAQLDVVSQEGSFVIPDDYIIQTALDGTVDFDILPGVYDATTVAVGGRTVAFRVSVPDEPAADFADLLNASYVEIPPASVTQAQQARDAAIAARDVAVAARDDAIANSPRIYDSAAALLADTTARPSGTALSIRDGGVSVGTGTEDAAYPRNAAGAPLIARVGLDGTISTDQMGAMPGAAYDVTAKLQLALDDLGGRPKGGSLLVGHDTYFVSSLRIPPNVFIRATTYQPFCEGQTLAGAQLRQISGVTAPLVYTAPDIDGVLLRSAENAGNEGNQYYYNSGIDGVSLNASANDDTRADALYLERCWGFDVRNAPVLGGKRGFALRAIDCNVLNVMASPIMGPTFLWSVADSMFSLAQMGGGDPGTAAEKHFFPVLWLAGNSCWKNTFTGVMPFNNARNIGGQTWTFTASGSLLTLSGTHYFNDGDPVCLETTGTLPTGVTGTATYFVKRVSATTLRLCAMRKHVDAGTYLSLSGGSGTHTIRGGANCNLFLSEAQRNIFSAMRLDQGYGSGAILRGASKNVLSGVVSAENGLGLGGASGYRLELGSNNNVMTGCMAVGDANQTTGVYEDATCSGNTIDVLATGHTKDFDQHGAHTSLDYAPILLGSDRFEVISGSPTIGPIGGNRRNGWLMDATSDEIIGTEILIPNGWASIKVTLFWVNAGAGSGSVVWAFNGGQFSVGSTINAADTKNSFEYAFAAGAQDVLMQSVIPDAVPVTDGELLWLRIKRVGSALGDTLANDAALIAVRVDRVS